MPLEHLEKICLLVSIRVGCYHPSKRFTASLYHWLIELFLFEILRLNFIASYLKCDNTLFSSLSSLSSNFFTFLFLFTLTLLTSTLMTSNHSLTHILFLSYIYTTLLSLKPKPLFCTDYLNVQFDFETIRFKISPKM